MFLSWLCIVTSSALQANTQCACPVPLVRAINQKVHELKLEGRVIEFCWILAHVGLTGNDCTDHLEIASLLYDIGPQL